MLASQIKVGVRVRCVFPCNLFGKTGTISRVCGRLNNTDLDYYVCWDDASSDDGWSYASSMEMLEDQTNDEFERIQYAMKLL